MHEVCSNIRDPKLWEGVPPDRMFEVYMRRWDARVTRAFEPQRARAVVTPREPLFAPDGP